MQETSETSKALITKTQVLEEQLKRDEKRFEDLKKSIEQSKKNARDKKVKLAELKFKVQKQNDEHDSASKRMSLLTFEYFDVAKKIKEAKSKPVKNFKLHCNCF